MDSTRGAEAVEQGFHRWELREEFLDHFAHGFEDGVVEDGSRVEADAAVGEAVVGELVLDALADVAEGVVFVFFGQAVGFVDEDFEMEAWVELEQGAGGLDELVDGLEVFVLHVYHPDYGACGAEDGGVVEVWGEDGEVVGEFGGFEFHEGSGKNQ